MAFPLKDWIELHSGAPHHLARSGMQGTLRTVDEALRQPEAPDAEGLRTEVAAVLGVAARRVFLTHGATEGNTAVLFFLAGRLRRTGARTPRFRAPVPEYPPLVDAATLAGLRRVSPETTADVAVFSCPNNPTGRVGSRTEREDLLDGVTAALADETFREFGPAASLARAGTPRLWTTGTFTKVYGADALRVGYVVAPEEARREFAAFHGVLLDELPPASVAGARAILAHRRAILDEVQSRFRRNRQALGRAVPGVPSLDAPVWFDRGSGGLDGDRLQRRLIRAGILVCSGAFFGDPTGVRVCLTQPSFPADLAAYLHVRDAGPAARARP